MQELIRLFLVEAGDAPASSASAAVQLRPAALEDEAEDDGAAEAMQQHAQRRAREIAAQAGAREAATVWTCVCGCAVNWAPCPGCGADVPQRAMQAAIAGVRPVLDAAPDGSGAATHAFRRGVLDGYAVGRSGLLKEQPAAFRLCDAALMPAPPPPSAAVRLLQL